MDMPKKLQVLGPFAKQPDYNQEDENQIDYIKNKPKIATDDEIIALLNKVGFINSMADEKWNILTDESGNVLIL